MQTIWRTRLAGLALLGLGLLLAAGQRAAAFPITVVLHDVTFDDGGTASGSFTLNVSGYLTDPTRLVTTAGTVLGGASYDLTGSSYSDTTHVDLTIPSPPAAAAYLMGLDLIFALPLGSVQVDPIVGGCEFTSFSCSGGGFRSITGGFATVPEPGTLGLALVGLGALGAVPRGRQRRLG